MLPSFPAASVRSPRVAIAGLVLIGMLAPTTLRAAESTAAASKIAASLEFVPADISFYSVTLRGAEQIQIIRQSKAWAKFKSLPSVMQAWDQFDSQWKDGSLSFVRQIMSLPENEQLVSLLAEMVSQEVFVYGDPQCAVTLDLASQIMNTARFSGLAEQIRKLKDGGSDDDAADDKLAGARAVLDTLDENADDVEMPGIVFGFKLKDRTAAQTQLKRLEVMLGLVLSQNPDLKNRLARKKVGDGDYLTLSLDGSLVPWEQIPFDQVATEPGQYDDLVAKLKSLTLVISLGLRENFVLLSIAKSDEHLAALGTGDLLVDEDEFEPLAKFAQQRLIGIQFFSEDIIGRLAGNPDDLDQLTEMAQQLLEGAAVDEDMQKTVLEDVSALANDLKNFVPEPGPLLAFSFLTPRGVESYSYDWSQNLQMDVAQRLSLLEHVGGKPLAMLAARSKVSPQQYELLVKWLKKTYSYVDRLAVPQLKPEDKQHYDKVVAIMLPLLARLDKTTSTKLIPALADGQSALVLDGKLTSKRWFGGWPETVAPMPMAELALVLGVSDAKLLKAALAEYMAVADEAIVKIRELNPDAIPAGFKLLRPQSQVTSVGETFAYTLPAELGVDAQIVPNAGLNKNTVVLALSLKHTMRLLAATPFKGEGPLADTGQVMGMAGYLDWAGLVDAAAPWIDLAVQNYGEQFLAAVPGALGEDETGKPNDNGKPEAKDKPVGKQALLEQVHTVLLLAKVLRTVSMKAYRDDDAEAIVRHAEVHFQDLP